MSDLRIRVGETEYAADWTGDNPETRDAIADVLPLEASASRWGDELYFPIPVDAAPTTTQLEVPQGAIAYWPQGSALCLFWGPTPASEGDEPRAAAPVGVVGQLESVVGLDSAEDRTRVVVSHG